jgi:hypothetical protein
LGTTSALQHRPGTAKVRPERALIESPLPGTVVSRLENVSVLVETKRTNFVHYPADTGVT